jgi:hypothetical protein
MRLDLAAADERHEVRRAIAAWREGGAIDAATAERLHARFPDDRRRARLAFRLLFFFFTLVAGIAAWGFGASFLSIGLHGSFDSVPHAIWLALLAGGAGWGAALAIGPRRLRGFGVEEGLAALALGFGVAAVVLLVDDANLPGRGTAFVVGLAVASVAAIAARRWGLAGSGLVATGGLLLALGALPAARLGWVVAAIVLAVSARHWRGDERRPVAHRHRAVEVYVVALVTLWLAAHPSHVASHGLSDFGGWFDLFPGFEELATAFGWLVVVALPALLLASGVARRDRLELALGAIGVLAAGATLIDALDLGPPWAVVLGSGALLAAVTWALRRGLAARPQRTWGGFTDRELLGATTEGSWLELAATLAALSPAPRPVEEPPAFEGEGGEFGGGGASSRF